MRRSRILGSLATLAALTLVVSGCAAATTDGGDKSNAVDQTKAQVNPHPVADLKDGGDLRLALSQVPTQWNYYHADGSLLDAASIHDPSLPRVFVFDVDGKSALNTDYVTKAEVTSTDPQTVTYTINPKAVWSDGSAITWKDFEAVWKGNSGENPEFQSGDTTGYRDIKTVAAGADDHEVVVTFDQTFGDWQKLFIYLYPASTIDTPEKFNTGWLNTMPLSAGPFLADTASVNKTAQTVTLARNDKWWGAAPKLDTITFRALDSTADVDAYLNNELDVVAAGNTERYGRVKDAPNTDFRVSSSPAFSHITFGSGGVLSDTATRVALSQAIDRSAIVKAMYSGIPYTVDTLDNHLILNTEEGYQANADVVKFDVEAAKKGFEAAGWKLEGDVLVRDGKKLEPRLVIPSGVPVSQQIAEIIQQTLAQVGVAVKIDAVSSDAFFQDNVTPGNFDMTIFSWSGTGYVSDAVSIYQSGDNTQNFGKISTPEITDLLNQANAELDATARTALLNKADTLIWAEGHSLTIAQSPRLVAIRPGLANIGAASGNGKVDWTTVGWLKD